MTTIDRAFLDLPAAIADLTVPALPEAVSRARVALASAASDYLAIPDSTLERPWLWRGHNPDGVRYGVYRAAETVEAASAELEAALAGAPARSPATIRTAPATVARWALQGRLAGLDDSLLDRIAKEGEWTIRQTLAHTIGGQRGYGTYSRWWVSQPLGADRPARIGDEAEAELDAQVPAENGEALGTVADIRARLDAVLDEWALRFADLDAAALAVSATWAGVPMDIDFRLGRWASHIEEHTVQLDKTLSWVGYTPSEVHLIVRNLCTAWGRLESRLFPVAPEGTDAAVATILDRMASTLTAEARSARAAAEA